MDLQTRKIKFVQEFLKLQSEELVSQFENLLKMKAQNKIKPMSLNELNSRIDKSERDFKNGKFKTSSELLSKYKK
jgi:ribosomal protein L29